MPPSRSASGGSPPSSCPAGRSFPTQWMLAPPFIVGLSVVRTLLVAGTLAIIAQYFRSARVKAWAALKDETPR